MASWLKQEGRQSFFILRLLLLSCNTNIVGILINYSESLLDMLKLAAFHHCNDDADVKIRDNDRDENGLVLFLEVPGHDYDNPIFSPPCNDDDSSSSLW